MKTIVRESILALAQEHGLNITEQAPLEKMAEAISALSDSDPRTDDARRALIRLRLAGVVTQAEGHAWLLRLADEEDAASANQIGHRHVIPK